MELRWNSLQCLLLLFLSVVVIELQGFLFAGPMSRTMGRKVTGCQQVQQPFVQFATPPSVSIGINFSLPTDAAFMDLLSQTNEILSSANSSSSAKPITMTLSFSGSHKQSVKFNDSVKAEKYLSLPTNQYSVLSSAMVKRSIFNDDDFELTLPLRDFILNYENTTNDTTFHGFSKYNLLTTINVNSQPKKGKISMRSGTFRFLSKKEQLPQQLPEDIPIINATEINNAMTNITDIDANVTVPFKNESALPQTIPTWLIWRESNDEKAADHNKGISTEDVSLTALMTNASTTEIIKSAIQPKLRIDLTWGPRQRSFANTVKHSFFHSLKALKSGHTNTDHVLDMPIGEGLEVDIKVGLDLDVRIHSNHGVLGKLIFPPIKLLFEKVGSFILSKLIGYVGVPLFLPLLMKDYETRQFQ